jgi:putative oxidoreductase
MPMLRRGARLLLAVPYLLAGLDALRHPGPQAEAARPMAARLAGRGAGPIRLPADPEPAIRVAGAVGAAAATMLALGRLPRTSAAVLVLTSAPLLGARHPFWLEPDPVLRRQQRSQLLQAVGLLGGALLAALEGTAGIAATD